MPRYILIDDFTGYIYGDTADLKGWADVEQTPTTAAKLVDESLSAFDRSYEEHGANFHTRGQSAYHVYDATAVVVPPVRDGQDQEIIDAVEHACPKVAVVTIADEDIP